MLNIPQGLNVKVLSSQRDRGLITHTKPSLGRPPSLQGVNTREGVVKMTALKQTWALAAMGPSKSCTWTRRIKPYPEWKDLSVDRIRPAGRGSQRWGWGRDIRQNTPLTGTSISSCKPHSRFHRGCHHHVLGLGDYHIKSHSKHESLTKTINNL